MKGTCVLWYLFDSSISLEYFHTQSMRLEIILGVKVDKEQILKTLKCLVDGLGSKNNCQKFIEATLLLNLMSLGPFPWLRITWNRNEEKEKKSGKGKKKKWQKRLYYFCILPALTCFDGKSLMMDTMNGEGCCPKASDFRQKYCQCNQSPFCMWFTSAALISSNVQDSSDGRRNNLIIKESFGFF